MNTGQRLFWTVLSLSAFLVLWQATAFVVASRTLPPPLAVLEALVTAARQGELFYNIGATLARVAAAFLLALLLGSTIGILLGRSRAADQLFHSWLILFLNLPALVIIILCYVWFGLTEAAAVTAVAINKIPNVAVIMREGALALDRDLTEMARVYRFGRWKTLRHVVLPQLVPFFAAASRSGLALVWKIVLVVELLGRSSGVGFQIHLFFQFFDVASILAYTIAFIAVIQFIELAILQPLERRANRWRR